jgi:hypothetical protein
MNIARRHPLGHRVPALTLGLLLLSLGCGGDRSTGDRAGTVNWTLAIRPVAPSLATGQSVPFQAPSPWGGVDQWSVVPASAGTITSTGLFTASGAATTCTVFAVWSQDVRYAASTIVTILPAPPPAVSSPEFVQTFGAEQTVPDGSIANAAIVDEPIPAIVSASAGGLIQIRHDFLPPVTTLLPR